jgi:hypothetical protein
MRSRIEESERRNVGKRKKKQAKRRIKDRE